MDDTSYKLDKRHMVFIANTRCIDQMV